MAERRSFPRLEEASTHLTVTQLLIPALQSRRLIARVALGVAMLFGVVGLFGKRSYTVRTSFAPDARRSGGNLSGLVAQLGVPVGATGDVTESPQFYSDLVSSHELLRRAAVESYATTSGSAAPRRPLTEILKNGAPTDERAIQKTLDWLDGAVAATLRTKTGVVALQVTAQTPRLAAELSDRILILVNQFNLETRQSHASKEREFAQARILDVRRDLRESEDALSAFLARNRGNLSEIPDLAFQRDRLAREVQLRQAVYATVVQSFEQAKLDEVRNTPVITLIDRPHEPLNPDARGLTLRTLFILVLTIVLMSGFVVLRELLSGRLMHVDAGPESLLRLLKLAGSDLRRPWRMILPDRPVRAA